MEIARGARIYVAGHTGLAGSSIWRELHRRGFTHVLGRTHAELDLLDPVAVRSFYSQERPEFVFIAAAKVGGILANDRQPAEFEHGAVATAFARCRQRLLIRQALVDDTAPGPADRDPRELSRKQFLERIRLGCLRVI